ncbi:S1C family serine protease [Pseudonocardia phyllosphaerae]|uniref:S1C family serine protease n=1 Tax=Pseudonocardia phyllosphaerae TaxID=3390502 RepID=UPI00397B3302
MAQDNPPDEGTGTGSDPAAGTPGPETGQVNPWARPGSTSAELPPYPQQTPGDPQQAPGAQPGSPDPHGSGGAPHDADPGAMAPTAAHGAAGAPPPWAGPPTTPAAADAPRSGGRRLGPLLAGALALALVAGAIGGVVGAAVARSSYSTSGGSLAEPIPAAGQGEPTTPVEAVATRVLPSVVQLRVEGGSLRGGEQGEGSGMVISSDGLVLTNNHVVAPAATGGTLRVVLTDGRSAVGKVIGRDPQSDIALARVDLTGLTPVELGNSDAMRPGQQVTAIGAPLGLGGSVTTGIISALDRAVSVGGEAGNPSTVLNALQTDAAINPGNSGGPLVDMQGRVVGINSAIATAGPGGGSIGVGFSIPINQARRIADQLRAGQKATHAVLGVEVTDDPQQGGAVVRTVTPGGAAERAGLKPQDLVTKLGEQQIATGQDLQAAVRSQPPGSTVRLQLRDRTADVTLGED